MKINIRSCILRKSNQIILRDIKFKFSENDRIAVLGASGIGKSTLMHAILGYLDPNLWEVNGEVLWGSIDLLRLTPAEWKKLRGRKIRVLFQEPPRMVHPMFKIDNQIREAFLTVQPSIPLRKLDRKIDSIRSELRISRNDEKMGVYPHETSDGQLQRIALSISLGPPAYFFFADEPANSLDAEITIELIKLLRKRLDNGHLKGLFLITHDINIAKITKCNKVLFIDNQHRGHIVNIDIFLNDPGFEYGRNWMKAQRKIYESYIQSNQNPAYKRENVNIILKVNKFGYRYPIKGIIYRRGKPAIHNVNFAIKQGEFLGIVGNSGAGKSTIGKSICRILQDYNGKIFFNNVLLEKFKGVESSIQYIMQDAARSFDPNQKIEDHLKECIEGRRISWKIACQEVNHLFARLGLAFKILSHYPHELSAGQRQRIAFIRSILGPTELLVADELFMNLDPIVQLNMTSILIEKKKQNPPLSAIIISHNFGLLAPLCDKIVVLSNGRQLEAAPTKDLIHFPREKETQRLIYAAKKLGQISLG